MMITMRHLLTMMSMSERKPRKMIVVEKFKFNQVLKPSKAHLCCYHSIKIYFCYKDLFEEPHTRVGTTADFVGLRGPSVVGIFDLYGDYHCRYNKNPPSLLQQTKSYIINFNIKTPFDIPFCIRFNP